MRSLPLTTSSIRFLQKDYFRLQAYFSGLIPREDLPAATQEQVERNVADVASWEEAAKPFLNTIESIEAPIREKTILSAVSKFPPDVRPLPSSNQPKIATRVKSNWPIWLISNSFAMSRKSNGRKSSKGEQQKEWVLAKEYLKQLPAPKPKALPVSLTATDAGTEPAEVYVPGKPGLGPIAPGVPSIINPEAMPVQPMADRNSSGRRLALANWMVDRENQLTWRVIVNRVWQQHFGQGIVPNASDFGRLTETPTHPSYLISWRATSLKTAVA